MQGVHDREGCCSDKAEATFEEIKALQDKLQDNDSLEAGLTKLLLAGVSAVFVLGMVWVTCVWQLGSHSLGGWVVAALLLVWRLVVWLWSLVLWKPPSWYPAQVREDRMCGGSTYCIGTAWENNCTVCGSTVTCGDCADTHFRA
jgi:hypothetical protein